MYTQPVLAIDTVIVVIVVVLMSNVERRTITANDRIKR